MGANRLYNLSVFMPPPICFLGTKIPSNNTNRAVAIKAPVPSGITSFLLWCNKCLMHN